MSPMIFGPKKPPMLAVLLMNPTAAAAAEALKNAEGTAQNAGKEATVPNPTSVNSATSNRFECGNASNAINATAAVNCGAAKCQRRSRVRSELQPSANIPTSPPINGIAPIHPICATSVHPVSRCSIVGIQNPNAEPPV